MGIVYIGCFILAVLIWSHFAPEYVPPPPKKGDNWGDGIAGGIGLLAAAYAVVQGCINGLTGG